MVAPAFGAIGTQLQTTTANPAVAVPSGVTADQIIVVDFFIDGAVTVTGMPAGFAHAPDSPIAVPPGSGSHSQVVAWKRATGADAGTYAFTLSSSIYVNAAASRITGCITTGSPWDDTDAAQSNALGTASPAVTVITTGTDRLLYWGATNWGGGLWTPPTSFTERRDSGDRVITSADLAQAAAGSSGAISGTCAGNDRRTAWLGALLPVPPAGGSAPPNRRDRRMGALLQL